jgi:predicted glycosyltransferase involved in capsule biosynthesis
LNYFNNFFSNKEVIIVEQDEKSRIPEYLVRENEIRHYHIKSDDCHYKTRNLNYGISLASRKYIMMCDADIICIPESIYAALQLLNNGRKFVAPYNGVVVNIEEKFIKEFLQKDSLSEALSNLVYYRKNYNLSEKTTSRRDQYPIYGNSYYDNCGGCLLFNKKIFHLIGGYNPNIISYGYEDMEFNLRIEKMGYEIEKINNYNLYHLSHERKFDSYYNKYYRSNQNEYIAVQNMTCDELTKYVRNGFKKIKFDKKGELNIVNRNDRYSIEQIEENKYDLKGVSVMVTINSRTIKDEEEMLFLYNKIQDMVEFFDKYFTDYEIVMREINGEYFKYLKNKKNYIYYNVFINTEADNTIFNQFLEKANHTSLLLIGLKCTLIKENIIQMLSGKEDEISNLYRKSGSSRSVIDLLKKDSAIYFIKRPAFY